MTCDGADAPSLHCIELIDHADDAGLIFDDLVICSRLVGFAHVTISERRTAEHVDLALLSTMPLAAAGALENLGPLVFRDHALELQQQLIFRCGRAG